MKKAMLSQPMAGKSEAEIIATREKAIQALKKREYEVVNTLFTDEWYSDKAMKERGVVNIPLCFLAKSLENMSKCHAAYFCRGWEQARGCQIEHAAAGAGGQADRHRTRQRRVREYREVIRMCIAAQIILVAGAVIVAFFGVIGFGPNFKK